MTEREIRRFATTFEVRGLTGSDVELTGRASTFNQPYEMADRYGEYREHVNPLAFKRTLAANPDVAFLLNHGGTTMARTKSGTMRLEIDAGGLVPIATLDSRRTDVKDMLLGIERGDLNEMSFGFRVDKDGEKWNDDYTVRELTSLNLNRGDVSVVNFGANPNTSIAPLAARSQFFAEERSGLVVPDWAAINELRKRRDRLT